MKLLKNIYKIYLFLLPFQLSIYLAGIKDMFFPAASIENDFFLLLLSIVLFLIVKGIKFPLLNCETKKMIELIIFLFLISVFDSLIFYFSFGVLYGENTISATIPSKIYLLLTGVTMYYNAVFSRYCSIVTIKKIFDVLFLIALGIGYIQLLIINNFAFAKFIYDHMDALGVLVDSSKLIKLKRICLMGSEPSAIGDHINILLGPYILSNIICSKRKGKYIVFSLLMLPLIFLSYSSTAYIGTAVNLLIFFVLMLGKRKKKKYRGISLCCGILCSVIIGVAAYRISVDTNIGKDVQYFILEKTLDLENYSTATRYSSVLTDVKAFLKYPITGVGNGNQGYFYNETVRQYYSPRVRKWSEIKNRTTGSMGIVSGGGWVPSVLSGYGLVGITAIALFVKKCVCKVRKENYGFLKYMYYIGGISFLVIATAGTGLEGNFSIIFVLSIPLMDCRN